MREDCEICGSRSFLPLDEKKPEVDIVACRECGLVWNRLMEDQAEQLDFYQDDYREGQQITRRYLRSMLSRAACIMEFLGDDLAAGARHLDVGCSDGTLLLLSRARGAQVNGLELDAHFRRYAVEERGLPVVPAAIEEEPFEADSFDLISFSHVVEHLFHPVEQLRRAGRWLRPGGLLFVEVPNLEYPSPGPHSFFCRVHNFYFSPNTLRLLAHRAGFEPLRVGRSPRDQSLQLLARRRDGEIQDDMPWRDDAEDVYRRVRANHRRYYVTLRFLTRKLWREVAKWRAVARYGNQVPELR